MIELIVSVALFSVILTTALGGLLLVIDANRQAKAIKLVVNNLNLAMEGISRELRVGEDLCKDSTSTGGACNSGGSETIYFTTDRGKEDSVFRLRNGRVERRIETRSDPNHSRNAPFLNLTGDDITIDHLSFRIQGVGPGDGLQPWVTITLNGRAKQADQEIAFNIQTTVSQRKLEI